MVNVRRRGDSGKKDPDSKIMESEVLKQRKDDWWKFKQRVSDFNKIQKEKLYASYALVFDESMSAYTPR